MLFGKVVELWESKKPRDGWQSADPKIRRIPVVFEALEFFPSVPRQISFDTARSFLPEKSGSLFIELEVCQLIEHGIMKPCLRIESETGPPEEANNILAKRLAFGEACDLVIALGIFASVGRVAAHDATVVTHV